MHAEKRNAVINSKPFCLFFHGSLQLTFSRQQQMAVRIYFFQTGKLFQHPGMIFLYHKPRHRAHHQLILQLIFPAKSGAHLPAVAKPLQIDGIMDQHTAFVPSFFTEIIDSGVSPACKIIRRCSRNHLLTNQLDRQFQSTRQMRIMRMGNSNRKSRLFCPV